MIQFVRDNARWLAAGFLLTFTSAFGQTWFISQFADFIKDRHGLTDGSWGGLYTVATLSAAALMFWRGSLADTVPLSRLAPAVTLMFAVAAVALAWAPSVAVLVVALFLLRFCGQGMFSHMAMTAMGRWFEARRGQAVSLTNLGHPAGEIFVPLLVVMLIGGIGWRSTWLVVAGVLCLIVIPLLVLLLTEGRNPVGHWPAPIGWSGFSLSALRVLALQLGWPAKRLRMAKLATGWPRELAGDTPVMSAGAWCCNGGASSR